MDIIAIREKAQVWLKQYRYALLVLAAGLLLMLLPGESEKIQPQTQVQQTAQPELQDQLGELLSHMARAGKVSVLLTRRTGEETVYQTDREVRTDAQQTETVMVTGSDRSEKGLVRQINPPEYLGAVVLCQGADNAAVKLAIVEAVSKATGLSTDRITVLKMK